jgi:hypothetical protein
MPTKSEQPKPEPSDEDDGSNAYEYDENGKAIEPKKILSQKQAIQSQDLDADTLEKQRLEKQLSKINILESQMQKYAPPPAAKNVSEPTASEEPKETELQKQMRLGWNQDDEKDMDNLAKDTSKVAV